MAPNRNAFADPVRGHKQAFFKDLALSKELQMARIQDTGRRTAVGKKGREPRTRPASGLVHQSLIQRLLIECQWHDALLAPSSGLLVRVRSHPLERARVWQLCRLRRARQLRVLLKILFVH